MKTLERIKLYFANGQEVDINEVYNERISMRDREQKVKKNVSLT